MAKFLMSLMFPVILRGVSCREFNSEMEAGTWEWHRRATPQNHMDLLALARSGCKRSQKKLFWSFWAQCVNAAREICASQGARVKGRKTDMVFPSGDQFFVLGSEIPGTYVSMLCQGWRFKTGGDVPRRFVKFWIGFGVRNHGHLVDACVRRACLLFNRGISGREAYDLLVGRKNVLRDASLVTVGASPKALRGAKNLMRAIRFFGIQREIDLRHTRIRNRDAERIAAMSVWGALAVLGDILDLSDSCHRKEMESGTFVEENEEYRVFETSSKKFEEIHGEDSPFVGTSGKFRSTIPIRWEKVAESLKGRGWKVRLLERIAAWSGDELFRPGGTGRWGYYKMGHRCLTPMALWFNAVHRENPSLVWEEVQYLLSAGGLTLAELRQPLLAKWRKLCADSPRGEIGSDREWSVFMWGLLAAFGGNVQEVQSFLKVVGALFVAGERETPWHFAANNFGCDPLKVKTLLKWGKVWLATRTMPLVSDVLMVANKWEPAYADGKFEDARKSAAAKLYVGIPEDVSRVCGSLGMSQLQAEDYLQWLSARTVKSYESIPAPKADPVGGFRVRQLQADDLLGPLLGIATHCCQHPQGAARATASQGWTSPNGAFWVAEDERGTLIAMTHVWRSGDDVVLDSLESKLEHQKCVDSGCVGLAFKEAARSIIGRLGVVAVYCGANHTSKSATIGHSVEDMFGHIDTPTGESLYRGDSGTVYRMA